MILIQSTCWYIHNHRLWAWIITLSIGSRHIGLDFLALKWW